MSISWRCNTCYLINNNSRSQCQACFTKRAVIASNKIKPKIPQNHVPNTQIKTVKSEGINKEFDASSNNLDSFGNSNKYVNNSSDFNEHNDDEKDEKNNNNENDGTKLNSPGCWRCQKCHFINNKYVKDQCVACGPKLKIKSKKKLETWLERERSSPNGFWVLCIIAEIYHSNHNYNDARTYYRKILTSKDWHSIYQPFWDCAMSVYRKNCMNSSQRRASNCFDFKGDICKFIESKIVIKTPGQNQEQFSLINAIKYKVHYLIYGFTRSFNLPVEIKHLCLKYYINDVYVEMYDDKLIGFNQKGKTEIVAFILGVLSPHHKHQLVIALTDLIKLVHATKCLDQYLKPNDSTGKYLKNAVFVTGDKSMLYYYGVYLSLLTFISQQLNNMYLILQEAGNVINNYEWFWKNDYNIAMLNM
eukprot:17720_1